MESTGLTRWQLIINELNAANSKVHRVVFFGLLIIAVILRIAAFQGYADFDPRAYAELADGLAHGNLHIPAYDGPPVFPVRPGLYAPTAALINLFGLSEITITVYPFLISILGCLLTYTLARHIVMPLAGLIGLALMAITPIDIYLASVLWPDAVAAFFANAAVAIIIIAVDRPDVRHIGALGLLSGVLFGVSWFCKETVAYFVPLPVLLVFFLKGQTSKNARMVLLAAIGTGSLALVFAEMTVYRALTGDLFFRLHATEKNYVQEAVWFFNSSSPFFGWESGDYTKALAKRLLFSGPRDLLFNRSMLRMPALALVSGAWALIFRQRSLAMPLVWLVSLILMFNFMSSSFDSYKPLVFFDRYMYALLMPSLILVSGLLATLLTTGSGDALRKERWFWAFAIMVGLSGLSIADGRKIFDDERNIFMSRPEQVERKVSARLDKTDIVYTDYRTAANLVFFRNGVLSPSTTTTISWEHVKREQIPNGAYVLFNRDKTDLLAKAYKYETPISLLQGSRSWTKVWAFGNAELYLVNGQ